MVDSLVGNYLMHGQSTYTFLTGQGHDSTIITAIYNDTVTISAYNDSLVMMGGVACSYDPGSTTPYFFGTSTGTSGVLLVFYKNYPDSAMFTFGGFNRETSSNTVLNGRKMQLSKFT